MKEKKRREKRKEEGDKVVYMTSWNAGYHAMLVLINLFIYSTINNPYVY